MSRSTARIVAVVLAAPALLWGVALAVIVTADLPPLGGAAAGLPIASVAVMSLSGAIIAAIVARRGPEHRGDAPLPPLAAATIASSALVIVSAVALVLGPATAPAPAVADPAVESGSSFMLGDHSGHVMLEP